MHAIRMRFQGRVSPDCSMQRSFVPNNAFCYRPNMFNPLPDPVDPTAVRRVLVTKLRHHGDVLLASPVFTVLKRALPDAEIDALVYRETSPMLEGHPGIENIH